MLADVQSLLLAQMSDGAYFVDRERCITYWSPGAERITGYLATDVVGHSCADGILRHVTESGHQLCISGCPLAGVMQDGRERTANVYLHHKQGHRIPVTVKGYAIRDDEGRITGSLELFHARATNRFADSHERNRSEDAYVDVMTGIGNRRFGEGRLRSLIAATRESAGSLAVMFIDIDHFKQVNDVHGHRVGDVVLRMVGQNLANGLRTDDFPVRWGGEEFLVLMPGASQKALERAGERLRMLVENSWYQHGDAQVRVTISVGATIATAADDAIAVVDRADRLMYEAKAAGRNLVVTDHGMLPRPTTRPLHGNLAPWKLTDPPQG